MQDHKNDVTEALLREMIKSIILEKKKPGGGITKLGAEKILNPSSAKFKIRSAIKGEKGDIEQAAQQLDISPRTLYGYIDDDPSLEKTKDSSEKEANNKTEKK